MPPIIIVQVPTNKRSDEPTTDHQGSQRIGAVKHGIWSRDRAELGVPLSGTLSARSSVARLSTKPDADPADVEVVLPPEVSFLNCSGEGYAGVQCELDEWTCTKWIFQTFDDPRFSPLANLTSVFIVACIFISIICIVIETLPSLRDDGNAGKFFIAVEIFSTVIFTIEYVLKCYAIEPTPKPPFIEGSEEPEEPPEDEEELPAETNAQARWRWMRQPMEIIDVVAIAPFYIELICTLVGIDVSAITILKLLRVVRIFRVFKLSKYSSNLQLCGDVMKNSTDSLGLMIFMLMIVSVVFSSFEFFCEKGIWNDELGYYLDDNGNRSRFDSIPATMWWCVVTVMTVGYGDLYPITIGGKVVASGAMVCAILIMALPISVIGANFNRAWDERKAAAPVESEEAELRKVSEKLDASLADCWSTVESVLLGVTVLCENVSSQLAEAYSEYSLQRCSGETHLLDDENSRLSVIVRGVVAEQANLEEALRILILVQEATLDFEIENDLAIELSTQTAALVLQQQELKATVGALESVLFARQLT